MVGMELTRQRTRACSDTSQVTLPFATLWPSDFLTVLRHSDYVPWSTLFLIVQSYLNSADSLKYSSMQVCSNQHLLVIF